VESEEYIAEAQHLAALPPTLAAAVSDACASVSHNLNGQKLGSKGRVTRERIVAAAIELFSENDKPVTLASVARRAGLGLTSLYNYFTDLTELLIAVLEPIMATAESGYLAILRDWWPDEQLYENCYAFVHAYHAFWARNSQLLHMRNTLADRLDGRMVEQRIASTWPIIELLTWQMGEAETAGVSNASVASMLMTGIERSITLVTDRKLRAAVKMPQDLNEDRYLQAGARLLELAIADGRRGGR
jgi:AcrR family transcriptional regulator